MLLLKNLVTSMLALLQVPILVADAALNQGPGRETRSEAKILFGGKAGEPHGGGFSDKAVPTTPLHYRPDTITLYGCGAGEHFSKYVMSYRDNVVPTNGKAFVEHGTEKGSSKTQVLTLDPDEFINGITVNTWKKVVYKHPFFSTSRTRIGKIKLDTNKNRHLECGSSDDTDDVYQWWKQGHAFLYFEGSQGDALDQLAAYFVPESDY